MSRRGAVLLLAMVLPALLAWLYLVVLAQDRGPGGAASAARAPARNPAVAAAYGVSKAFQFSLPLLYVWWLERRPLRPGVPHFRGLALGVAFGLAVGVAAVGLYPILARHSGLFGGATVRIRAKAEEFGIGTPAAYVFFGLFLAVGHSFLEEYYWRWFVFGRLRQFLPRWPAVVFSSLAFMAHHVILLAVFFPGQFWGLAAPLSLGVAVGGAVWAWLYDRTGSIYAPWVSHALIDAAILWVGYEMVFGVNV